MEEPQNSPTGIFDSWPSLTAEEVPYDLLSSNTIPSAQKPPVIPVFCRHIVGIKNQQVTTEETGSKNMPVI